MKNILAVFVILLLILSCNRKPSNDKINVLNDDRDNKLYTVKKIGATYWMTENLKLLDKDLGSKCYEENIDFCKNNGVLYTLDNAIKACPKGWQLPTKIEARDFINNIDGDININKGKTIGINDLDKYNIQLSGLGIKRGDNYLYFANGEQEMWYTSSDTIFVQAQDSVEIIVNKRIGIHIYKKNIDSLNIELTFGNATTQMLSYCRCVKINA